MQLIWHGPVWGQSGYEVITRGILIALDKLGVRVRLSEANGWTQERIILEQDVKKRLERMTQVSVRQGTPVVMHQKKQPIFDAVSAGTKRYCYSLFETDRLPEPWRNDFVAMDGIFTFSEFNKQAWINSGILGKKIYKLPYGVEKEFTPDGPKAKILNKKGFTFLTNGDFTERKNFEALIEAYTTTFKPNEDVCLIFKTHYGGFTRKHRVNVARKVKELSTKWTNTSPKMLFYGDKISTQDMANLYRACDCLVLPSRGEGLGLPAIEAMACGLRTITTGWGALEELSGVKIDATIDIIDDIEFIKKCPHALNHKWANINVKQLGEYMRREFELKPEIKKEENEHCLQQMQGRTWHYAAVEILKVLFGGAS